MKNNIGPDGEKSVGGRDEVETVYNNNTLVDVQKKKKKMYEKNL